MGDCPCPRCYISSRDLDQTGTLEDIRFRKENPRVYSTSIERMVQDARSALYGGASLAATKVDKALKPMSLVPTMVS
jgi:hypothetical protein